MKPDTFARAFRRSLGIPPYRYFVARRIDRAKELLAHSTADITAIATEAGFASPSHFSATFKARVGCTPSEFSYPPRHVIARLWRC